MAFPKRRRGKDALTVRLKGAKIVLESGHKGDMAHRLRAGDSLEQIAYHRAVDLDVLLFGGLTKPAGKENVRGRDIGQSRLERFRVLKIGGDRMNIRQRGWSPGESVHGPVVILGEVGREIKSHDSRSSHHKGSVLSHRCSCTA